jgi:excisionase family DNA binding protein
VAITPLFVPPAPQLLEVAHVAHRLMFSQDYVRRLIRRQELPAIRFGKRWRVDPEDLRVFIDRRRAFTDRRRATDTEVRDERRALYIQPRVDEAV